MTLTWREELTLRIERLQAVLARDQEELEEVLDQVQARVLAEDRELRTLRAQRERKPTGIKAIVLDAPEKVKDVHELLQDTFGGE